MSSGENSLLDKVMVLSWLSAGGSHGNFRTGEILAMLEVEFLYLS